MSYRFSGITGSRQFTVGLTKFTQLSLKFFSSLLLVTKLTARLLQLVSFLCTNYYFEV